MERLDDGQHFRFLDPIVDSRSLTTRFNQPIGSQSHQLLRHRHLIDFEQLPKLRDRAFFFPQGA